ncbi:MAG: VWA domain-containing protein, partial [Rhizobiales bacterium]|nr:VWA domain-containing protein [Hyphomicrobiales bacterium]
MFVNFFHDLKSAGVPVTLKEYLLLMQALEAPVIHGSVEDFYYLARAALVKDERNLDRFDQVFGHTFKGLDLMSDEEVVDIPHEWLAKMNEKFLTEEEKAQIEA